MFAARAVQAQSEDSLQAWLAANAKPLRTIDPGDEDFSDLEPLAKAIGAARVVQLGEPSHGAGSSFAAKARIVKFLHQRLGFDVLIWESGLYDVSLADAAMRGPDNGMTAARKGVFALWSQSAEVKQLFDYVKASQTSARPINMAGVDLQVTADGSRARFAEDLRAFVAGLPDHDRAAALAEQTLSARDRLYDSKFANQADLEALTAATQELGKLIDTHKAGFIARAVANMRADAVQRFEAARGPTTPDRENRRDALNADNLRWLLDKNYAGRKAIVWAHNVHVMNACYDASFSGVHHRYQAGDMKPTGVFIANWLGKQVYTLGVTAFQGEDGFAMGGPATAVAPAPEGSVEAHLHALGQAYAFIDFRAVAKDKRSPPHATLSIRLPKYVSNSIADVGQIYDGLLYIDQMKRATRA